MPDVQLNHHGLGGTDLRRAAAVTRSITMFHGFDPGSGLDRALLVGWPIPRPWLKPVLTSGASARLDPCTTERLRFP